MRNMETIIIVTPRKSPSIVKIKQDDINKLHKELKNHEFLCLNNYKNIFFVCEKGEMKNGHPGCYKHVDLSIHRTKFEVYGEFIICGHSAELDSFRGLAPNEIQKYMNIFAVLDDVDFFGSDCITVHRRCQ